MILTIENTIKKLSEEFEELMLTFEKDDWKFFKFGQGGPYKRELSKIQKLSASYDKTILDRFGTSKEIATFSGLIVLSLAYAGNPKKEYKRIDTFRRQIKWMQRVL